MVDLLDVNELERIAATINNQPVALVWPGKRSGADAILLRRVVTTIEKLEQELAVCQRDRNKLIDRMIRAGLLSS